MSMRNRFACFATTLLGLLTLSLVTPAHAQLYGLSSSTPGTLYRFNTTTGAATAVTNLSGEQFTSTVGLAFLNNTIYASDVYDNTNTYTFGTINPTTGAYTRINNQGGSQNLQALTANSAANLLYTVNDDAANDPLETITPSGTITVIGNTNVSSVRGLAYVNGTLYAADESAKLYTLNTTTGASTLIGNLGTSGFRLDLAYDSANSTLYLNTGGNGNATDNSLYTVNITTGAATLVGSNGATNGFGIDGLAFQPAAVPEPSSLALVIGLGLTGAAFLRRRRR